MLRISLTLLTILTVTSHAWAVNCGDTLSGGVHTLTADLICSGDGPALIVRDGAVLDLGGHAVRIHESANPALIGILLDGYGATLRNGIVDAVPLLYPYPAGFSVVVGGAGGHQVVNVCGCNGWAGFVVSSNRNQLSQNWAIAYVGWFIDGHGNMLMQNYAGGYEVALQVWGWANHVVGNEVEADGALQVFGHQNTLNRNTIESPLFALEIWGHGNIALQNDLIGDGYAITVHGQGNRLLHNRTHGLSEDPSTAVLTDTNGDCAHNRWVGNTAAWSDPACILEGPMTLSRK